MSGLRKLRVESLLMEQVGEIISRGRIKDPRLDGIIGVTEVSLSGDFKDAKVYVSIVDRDTGHEEDLGPRVRDRRAGVVKALNHAAGYVQALVAKQIRLRSTPRLHFMLDTSIERGFNLTHKLEDLGG
jgi:ribosome-binding factor A